MDNKSLANSSVMIVTDEQIADLQKKLESYIDACVDELREALYQHVYELTELWKNHSKELLQNETQTDNDTL